MFGPDREERAKHLEVKQDHYVQVLRTEGLTAALMELGLEGSLIRREPGLSNELRAELMAELETLIEWVTFQFKMQETFRSLGLDG
jgi:hypothetical protein